MIPFRAWLALAFIPVMLVGAGMAFHSCKQKWELEQKVKAQEEVQQETQEVQREQDKRKQKVERMAPRELLDYWHGLQHDNTGSRKAPAPAPAGIEKR